MLVALRVSLHSRAVCSHPCLRPPIFWYHWFYIMRVMSGPPVSGICSPGLNVHWPWYVSSMSPVMMPSTTTITFCPYSWCHEVLVSCPVGLWAYIHKSKVFLCQWWFSAWQRGCICQDSDARQNILNTMQQLCVLVLSHVWSSVHPWYLYRANQKKWARREWEQQYEPCVGIVWNLVSCSCWASCRVP